MRTTIAAMKRIEEIKQRRQADYHKLRMRSKKQMELRQARAEIERDIDLVQAPLARKKLGTVVKPPKAKIRAEKRAVQHARVVAARRAAAAARSSSAAAAADDLSE